MSARPGLSLLALALLLAPTARSLSPSELAAADASAEYLFRKLERTRRGEQASFKLAACCLLRDEARYLPEWLLYHWVLGFQHFFLYDNESGDSPAAALAPFLARGLATLLPWPGRAPQAAQLAHCFNASRTDVKWMASFDVDEFVVVPGQGLGAAALGGWRLLDTLTTWLESDGHGAMLLDRLDFDAGGHAAPPPGLVLQRFQSRWLRLRVAPVVGKMLVLLRALERMEGAHDATLRRNASGGGWSKVTADWEVYGASQQALQHTRHEPVRIHHYVSRSHAECLAKARGGRWEAALDWRAREGAALCNRSMEGLPGFEAREHMRDGSLADSLWPPLLAGVLRRMLGAGMWGEAEAGVPRLALAGEEAGGGGGAKEKARVAPPPPAPPAPSPPPEASEDAFWFEASNISLPADRFFLEGLTAEELAVPPASAPTAAEELFPEAVAAVQATPLRTVRPAGQAGLGGQGGEVRHSDDTAATELAFAACVLQGGITPKGCAAVLPPPPSPAA